MPKINAKVVVHGGGSSKRKPTTFEQMTKADLVIGLYEDGRIRILKDRYTGTPTRLSGNAPTRDVINRASFIVAHSVFGDNNLKMFKAGLMEEIEKSIHETIEKYHKKVR